MYVCIHQRGGSMCLEGLTHGDCALPRCTHRSRISGPCCVLWTRRGATLRLLCCATNFMSWEVSPDCPNTIRNTSGFNMYRNYERPKMLRIIHHSKYSYLNQVVINSLEQIPDLFGPYYPKILMSLEVSIYFPTVPVVSNSLSINVDYIVGQKVLESIGEICWTTLRF